MVRVYLTKTEEQEDVSAAAHQLFEKVLEQEYPGISFPVQMSREAQGKPYLTEYPDIHFNISHSGGMAACALSDRPVGVDVEMKKNRSYYRMVSKLHPLEQVALSQASDEEREELFYSLWVRKESFVKAKGTGLRTPLDSFCVLGDEEDGLYFHTYQLDREPYSLAVCSEDNDFAPSPIRIQDI